MSNAERLFNAARRLRDWEMVDHAGQYAELHQLDNSPEAGDEAAIIEELFEAVAVIEREGL